MVEVKNIWMWAAAALLCTTIASSYMALNYQAKTVQLQVPLDASLLTATQLLCSVDYTTSELGAFINTIDDIGGDADTYWLWFYLDEDTGVWEYGPSGADLWVLHNGDTVAWAYTSF
jgi:hypothetical protein